MKIARAGYCSMDPYLSRWVKMCSGEQVGAPHVMHTMRLDTLFALLLPDQRDAVKNLHDAGSDADMTRKIYVEALRRAGVFLQAPV